MKLPASTAVAHLGIGAVRATVVKPDDTITCTLKINNPHHSTHVPGTVNVVGTIKCTAAVSSLAINVGLYFNGNLVAQGKGSNTGRASVQGNAAKGCVTGSYQGGATGAVVFPPGYEPPSSNFGGKEYYSSSVPITC